jgi:hypothetical protein
LSKFELLNPCKGYGIQTMPHSGTPTAYWMSYYFIADEREFAGNYRTSDNSKLAVRCLLICAYCMEMKNTVSQVALNMIFLRSFHTATATGLLLALIPLIASA